MASIRQRRIEQSPPNTNNGSKKGYSNINNIHQFDNNNEVITCGRSSISSAAYDRSPKKLNMIPDKYYRDFMMGGDDEKKSFERKKPNSFISGHACADICIGFSYVGMVFMFWVGFITNTQPIFIKGIKPKDGSEGITYNVTTQNQKLPATKHAYQTCFAYFMTILLCKAYQANFFTYCHARIRRIISTRKNQRYKHQYQDIPDHHPDDHHQLPNYFPSQKNNQHRT